MVTCDFTKVNIRSQGLKLKLFFININESSNSSPFLAFRRYQLTYRPGRWEIPTASQGKARNLNNRQWVLWLTTFKKHDFLVSRGLVMTKTNSDYINLVIWQCVAEMADKAWTKISGEPCPEEKILTDRIIGKWLLMRLQMSVLQVFHQFECLKKGPMAPRSTHLSHKASQSSRYLRPWQWMAKGLHIEQARW